MFESTRRRVLGAIGTTGVASLLGTVGSSTAAAQGDGGSQLPDLPRVDRVAADPTDVPDPIDRSESVEHDVTLTCREVIAEIEPGVEFPYLTFGGQVPGPMLRVRRGDTVSLTVENPEQNRLPHNVDLHAVYGTGGGSVDTDAVPGEQNSIRFQATYPGAYVYHCAVYNLDYHISSGMYGLIVVEPEDGLPPADQELYFGHNEIYTDREVGAEGAHAFSFDEMMEETPTYVTLNGEFQPFTDEAHGAITANQGDTIRVFFVNGGPNYSTALHPIGNVWRRAWRDGAPAQPEEFVQTLNVPPGSSMMGHMETPVPERITFVDHALTRAMHRGMLGHVDVEGEPDPEIYEPDPGADTGDGENATQQVQHQYDADGGAPPIADAVPPAEFGQTIRQLNVEEDHRHGAGGSLPDDAGSTTANETGGSSGGTNGTSSADGG